MKILFVSTPLTGHLNPLLAVAGSLRDAGHEIACLSATALRNRIEAAGAEFHAFSAGADLDLGNRDAIFPEWAAIPPGSERLRWILERAYVDTIPAQHESLQRALAAFPADVVVADNMMFGILPMLLSPRPKRPPIIVCSAISPGWRRDDGAPSFAGLPPAKSDDDLRHYAAFFKAHQVSVMGPVEIRLAQCLVDLGIDWPAMNMFDTLVTLPDAYLQMSVRSFEFPQRDMPPTVHFVGTLPIISGDAALPSWADELDGTRKLVLVTQGTLANYNYDFLITPTLRALKNEQDILVLVTTGGRPTETVQGPIPKNARLTPFVPFAWLLPKIDLLVTNGGYGSVNQALSHGIPLVTSGLTEDKADVNARVAWCGVGVDLATNAPTPEALHGAVRKVLDDSIYRTRAQAMAEEFNQIDTRAEILRIVSSVRHAHRISSVRIKGQYPRV